jgi:excinuclease ABC subunit A
VTGQTADWIIDLGPEAWPGLDPGASDGGGEIVAAGTPEDIVKVKRSYTGAFLAPVLARSRRGGEKKRVEAAE